MPPYLLLASATLVLALAGPGQAQEPAAPASGAAGLRQVLSLEVVTREAVERWVQGEIESGRGREAARWLVDAAARPMREGDPETAVRLLEAARRADPEAVAPLSLLGRAHSHLRDYESAEAVLREATARGDVTPTTLVFLGAAQWENGRLEEAEGTYERAVAASGGHPLALAQLGRLRLWRGRYEEAVAALEKAVAAQPNAVEVRLDLAEALRGSGRIDEAIAAFEIVVAAAPDLMKARYGLARLLAQRGDLEASRVHLEAYQRLYQADQERTLADELWKGALDLARDLLARERAQEALQHLESLPETVEVLELRSRALVALGRSEEALATLQRAVVLDPARSDLRRLLGEMRSRVGGGP